MTDTKDSIRHASNSPWLEHAVRVGLVAYGVVHLLIAWLALQLAVGDRSGAPDQSGALHQLASQPLGAVTLWVAAFGLFALTLWQAVDALLGHRKHDGFKRGRRRVGSAGKAGLYVVLGVSAIKTAVGESSGSNEDQTTARLMELPLGRWLVGLVGVVIMIAAIAHVTKAVTMSFEDDLDADATTGSSGTAVTRLAQIGYSSKGVAFGIVGGLFLWAAWSYDPVKAGGLDTALRTLLDQAFGPWLLGLVAVGIGCFGLYCLAWARYADTTS